MSELTGTPHAHVHVDVEGGDGPGLALSFLASTSFTRPGSCKLHLHVYEGEERLLARVERLGAADELVSEPLREMTPLAGTLISGEVAASGNGTSCRVVDAGGQVAIEARGPDFELDLSVERDEPRIGSICPGTDEPLSWMGDDGYFSYRILVPRGRAQGSVKLADGSLWPIAGTAYVDEQWGTRHFSAAIAGWEWYRVDAPGERIYVMTDVLHGGPTRRTAVIVTDSGVLIGQGVERTEGPTFAPLPVGGADGVRLVDRILDREITLELGQLMANDDLVKASGGRVRRFYRRSTRYAVSRAGTQVAAATGRVGIAEFADHSRA